MASTTGTQDVCLQCRAKYAGPGNYVNGIGPFCRECMQRGITVVTRTDPMPAPGIPHQY